MSFTNLNYHIVFATKERRPLIREDVLPRLKAYIAAIIKDLEGIPVEINGPADHLHVVAILSAKLPLMECVKKIKGGAVRGLKAPGQARSSLRDEQKERRRSRTRAPSGG